jgi:hypothetical protein
MNRIWIAGRSFRQAHVIVAAVALIAAVALVTYLVTANDSESIDPNGKSVSASDLVASPHDYKNFSIDFTGKVFVVEGKAGEQALQVYSDAENLDGNIIVYNFSSTQYSEDDFVQVKGVVHDASEGENAFGAKLTIPVVIADTIQAVSADEALSPTVKLVKVDQSKKLGKLTVTLSRVEYAENETRLYLTFDNKTSDDYELYTYTSRLVQKRERVKEKSVYDRGEDVTDSDISAGTLEKKKLYYGRVEQGVPATFTTEVMNQTTYESSKLSFSFR